MTDARPTLAALRRFARAAEPALPRCETCGGLLRAAHRHLFDPQRRELRCACDGCAHGAAEDTLRPVPLRVRALQGLELPQPLWRALGLPVQLAFITPSSQQDALLAVYPGPAGATQTQVPPHAWCALERLHPALAELAVDVEALLANRLGGAQRYYVAPIDVCYQLVGRVRAHYRGLDGGPGLRAEISTFFAELDARAEVVRA